MYDFLEIKLRSEVRRILGDLVYESVGKIADNIV